ncbi:Uncharacterised protein [Legionella lansingensis]|uniref:Uncharacterized protein n=1 Tax=Legionella lansingensis TaxID=45067 RepID=A0A0W0VIU3_9GAMM|nr:hypothetical protein Llan_1979 [Legionella lansingensis]SNV50974.1 Uncharacterised protein [Legionella lansingensis]
MNSKEYGVRKTPKKDVTLRVNLQEFAVKGICKGFLFTSSSLHKHKRKQPS